MKSTKTLSFFILLIVQAFLVLSIYIWDNGDPTLRTDVVKVMGKLVARTSDSALIQNPGPISLQRVERYRPYSSVGKTIYDYEFDINRKTISSKFISSWCFLSSCHQVSKIDTPEYDKVVVYYDPIKPEDNWLFPPPIYSDLEKFLFSFGIMSAISMVLTYLAHRPKIQIRP